MRNYERTLILGTLSICAGGAVLAATADVPDNPYQPIVQRNAFGLHDPVKPPPPEVPKPRLPGIKFTGTMNYPSRIAAVFEITPLNSAPNAPKVLFPILAAGEQEGELEVLRIDAKAGNVDVRLSGTVTNLTFERNGQKPPAAAPAMPAKPPVSARLSAPSQPESQLGHEQNALIIEAERERLRQAADPLANLMPVTHLTPSGAPGTMSSRSTIQSP